MLTPDDINTPSLTKDVIADLQEIPRRLGAVKVSVFRRFENAGHGKPVVILGEEPPGDGWMLCRTAQIDLSQSSDQVLLEIANEFASFGLQYNNKVGHITEVLEDFAAVCTGLNLPLPISASGWEVYGIEELQSATEIEYRKLLREIERVFGRWCATEQARTWNLVHENF